MTKEDFNEARSHIDTIDSEIIDLLNIRCSLVELIGDYKKENKLPVENLEREYQILVDLSKKERYNNMVNTIYPIIFKFSKDLESK